MVHWICISRQFASGGREIGQKVAQALGIPCYDRELITQSAEEHQLSADVVRDNEEFASRHLMFSYPLGSMKAFPSSYKEPMSLPDQAPASFWAATPATCWKGGMACDASFCMPILKTGAPV